MTKRIALAFMLLLGLFGATPSVASAHNPEPWRIAFITYRTVHADCQGRHIRATLNDSEYQVVLGTQRKAVATLKLWNPNLGIQATYITRSTLSSVSATGDGCWPAPSNVPSPGAFDTVYVSIEAENDADRRLWYTAAGLSLACGTCAYGGGYSTSAGATWYSYLEPEIIIHEWLHPTAAWFRSRGAYTPDPHNEKLYGFTEPWMTWYRAIVQGTLADRDGDGYRDGMSHTNIHKAGTPH